MDHNRLLTVCARCRERIGVYEPLWLELSDGTLRSCSYLNLDQHEPHERVRLWHHGCLGET